MSKEKDLKEIVELFLRKRGWSTWYHKNAWIHEKTVADPTRQDCTNYAMDLKSALIHEVENLSPFGFMGMPEVSKALTDRSGEKEIIEYYFGGK